MATAGNQLQIQWYPGSMRCELIRHDAKSEYVFKFKIKDLKKKDAKGSFQIQANDASSFIFWVNAGDKPMLKCRVSNLPEPMDTKKPPAHKIDDGYIQITVKKTTKNNWDTMLGADLPWKYQDPVDIV